MSYFNEPLEEDTASVAKSEIFEEKSFLFLGRVSKSCIMLYRWHKKSIFNWQYFSNSKKAPFLILDSVGQNPENPELNPRKTSITAERFPAVSDPSAWSI